MQLPSWPNDSTGTVCVCAHPLLVAGTAHFRLGSPWQGAMKQRTEKCSLQSRTFVTVKITQVPSLALPVIRHVFSMPPTQPSSQLTLTPGSASTQGGQCNSLHQPIPWKSAAGVSYSTFATILDQRKGVAPAQEHLRIASLELMNMYQDQCSLAPNVICVSAEVTFSFP